MSLMTITCQLKDGIQDIQQNEYDMDNYCEDVNKDDEDGDDVLTLMRAVTTKVRIV